MYPPQNSSEVATELASYVEVIRQLRQYLHVLWQGDVSEQLEKLSLNNHSALLKDPRKWFNTCFDQIQKAAEVLNSDGLEHSTIP